MQNPLAATMALLTVLSTHAAPAPRPTVSSRPLVLPRKPDGKGTVTVGGDLGPQRKLYYRELIARFAHHMALNWNLGEEINNATHEQKVAWANYFHTTDPYRHHIVIHNMGEPHYDLLGKASALTGFSLQTSKPLEITRSDDTTNVKIKGNDGFREL